MGYIPLFSIAMPSTQKQLLAEIEAFLRDTGMNQTTFGLETVNNGKFVPDLRKGRDPKTATVDKVRRYMARKRRARAA